MPENRRTPTSRTAIGTLTVLGVSALAIAGAPAEAQTGKPTMTLEQKVGDDTLNGEPIKMRFRWSKITPTSAHWEQAFSPDGGKTWETNWTMEFTRAQ